MLVAGSLIAVVVSQVGRVSEVQWRFAPGWLALAVVCFGLLQLAHGELWRVLLGILGFRLAPARSRAIWNVSSLARYVPTGLVAPVMRATMAEREQVPRRVCLVSVVYELGLALTGALIIGTYVLLRLPQLDQGPWHAIILAIPVLALVALHPRLFHWVTDAALKRFGREPLPLSVPFGRLLTLAGAYALTFVLAGVGVLALVLALHPVASVAIPDVLAAHAVGFTASVLGIMLPGGLGAREAAVAAALTLVVPTAVAIAVAVGVRLVQLALEIVFAIVTPVLARSAKAPPRPAPG